MSALRTLYINYVTNKLSLEESSKITDELKTIKIANWKEFEKYGNVRYQKRCPVSPWV